MLFKEFEKSHHFSFDMELFTIIYIQERHSINNVSCMKIISMQEKHRMSNVLYTKLLFAYVESGPWSHPNLP